MYIIAQFNKIPINSKTNGKQTNKKIDRVSEELEVTECELVQGRIQDFEMGRENVKKKIKKSNIISIFEG